MNPARNAFLLIVSLLIGWGGLSQAGVAITYPFEGITLIARTETSPRQLKLHVAQIDLTAPGISFKLSSPGGSRETIRQTTLNFLKQENAQLAVNVHFFVPYPSDETDVNVVGLAASQGTVYSAFEPQPVGAGYVDQSYAILQYGPALNIDRSNHVTIIHRDAAYPDNRHVLERVTLWTALSGSAQIVSNGVKTIPAYSGAPGGLNPSRSYSETNSWYSLPRARTAIGVTVDQKTLVILTVDQAGGSAGLAVGEVADMLIKDYQVGNALNLDGGGSTTLVLQDPVTGVGRMLNVSSDGARGRAVGSNLAVFARPVSGATNGPP